MFLDLRDCVHCVYLEKFALLFISCIMLPSVFPRYVKYKMNVCVFSHLGEIAAETGG